MKNLIKNKKILIIATGVFLIVMGIVLAIFFGEKEKDTSGKDKFKQEIELNEIESEGGLEEFEDDDDKSDTNNSLPFVDKEEAKQPNSPEEGKDSEQEEETSKNGENAEDNDSIGNNENAGASENTGDSENTGFGEDTEDGENIDEEGNLDDSSDSGNEKFGDFC